MVSAYAYCLYDGDAGSFDHFNEKSRHFLHYDDGAGYDPSAGPAWSCLTGCVKYVQAGKI